MATRRDVKNRLDDESRGIRPGSASFHPSEKEPAEPIPDIAELGIPMPSRRVIERDVDAHAALGAIERQAAKDKAPITKRLKALLPDVISLDETPKFACKTNTVNLYMQKREKFDREAARNALLNLGVKPQHVQAAWAAATTTEEILTLRIRAAGEDDE